MISIIAAYSKNKVIGKNGKIPWSIKEDMQHFKNLTTGNILIMGRKTYEDIGFPLPNRFTIVISSQKTFDTINSKTVMSFKDAVAMANTIAVTPGDFYGKNIFICGGQQVYNEALPKADFMYITEIDAEIEGDAFFPDFDKQSFCVKSIEKKSDQKYSFSFIEYKRI